MSQDKPLCGVMGAPCKTCPYRRDVPSGVWDPSEYAKLPTYDGEIFEQLLNGATGLFLCHQKDGNLCAGWLAAHGPDNLLALRLKGHEVTPQVWDYQTHVPVFGSGREAAAHGLADIDEPGQAARRAVARLTKRRG